MHTRLIPLALAAAFSVCASPASAQQHDHAAMQAAQAAQAAQAVQEGSQAAGADSQATMPMPQRMQGAYGAYPMTREASGTSWQPDSTPMEGLHDMGGTWMTMWHGNVTAVLDRQGGPRGGRQSFAESMLMFMGQRPLAGGTVGLRAMVSADPAMGKYGYPLLFQTGETADGHTALVDRQHPHDLLMELSASYSHAVGSDSSVFGYIGLPGEPALGPPVFMHRASGMDNPEAPLTHHWLDSTHITFGVITGGVVWRNVKLEVSLFNGREPDQFRWNMETRKLDSASMRLSWNPSADLALQVSHGRLDSPEGLDPDVAVRRTTASLSWQHTLAGWPTQSTFAWGRNRHDGGASSSEASNGYLFESASRIGRLTTVFGRLEQVDNGELFGHDGAHDGGVAGPAGSQRIGKLSIGVVRDLLHVDKVTISAGALVSKYRAPAQLDAIYGSAPSSAMLFFRARLAM